MNNETFTKRFGYRRFADDMDFIPVDLKTARTFVILKKFTRSRHGYGKCAVCAAPNTTFDMRLERRWWSPTSENFDVYLTQTCVWCGRHNEWVCEGLAEESFVPQSSFAFERDSQRGKCYAWQREEVCKHYGKQDQTLEQATAWVHRIFNAYHMAVPDVKTGQANTSKMYGEYKMYLVTGWGYRPWVIVHEAAHAVAHKLMRLGKFRRQAGHGSLWVAVYILMIEEWLIPNEGIVCRARLEMTAKKAGLKVETLEDVRQALDWFRSGEAPR